MVLALSPNHKIVYTANAGSDSISAVDLASRRVLETYPVCHQPTVVRTSQTQLFAGCHNGVSIVDLATKTALRMDCGLIWDLLLTHDSHRLYITSQQHGIYVLDTETRKLTLLSPVLIPIGLALTPDERALYVSYQGAGPGGSPGHDPIAQLDPLTGRIVHSITGLANVGMYLTIAAGGKRLWATGADACSSIQYDHVGCPAVPAGLIHVLNLPQGSTAASLAWIGRTVVDRFAASPSGTWILANGIDPVLYRQETAEAVAVAHGLHTFDAVFPENDSSAVVSLTELDSIGFVDIHFKARLP